jgi:hypothetical protein
MVCFHRGYNLGDNHDYESDDYSGWGALYSQICKDYDIVEIRPIYLYDHSGITISHNNSSYPFNCQWDAGQIGWHFVTKKDYREAYKVERISKTARKQANQILDDELKWYDYYLTGQIYWWKVESDDINESCSGFLGNEFKESGLYESIKMTIDDCLENKERENKYELT